MPSFADQLTGFGSPLAPQPVSGGDNDLTRYQRSVSNYLGTAGKSAFETGAGGVGSTMDFWNRILSNDPSAIMQFLQPQIATTNAQYDAARRNVNTFAPMGGGRSTAMAELPFQQAGAISNILAGARPQAAAALGPLALGEQGIGQGTLQSAIAAILQKMGINVTESGQNKALAGSLGGQFMGDVQKGLQPFLNAAAGLPH